MVISAGLSTNSSFPLRILGHMATLEIVGKELSRIALTDALELVDAILPG